MFGTTDSSDSAGKGESRIILGSRVTLIETGATGTVIGHDAEGMMIRWECGPTTYVTDDRVVAA